jgi:hypothetical protein
LALRDLWSPAADYRIDYAGTQSIVAGNRAIRITPRRDGLYRCEQVEARGAELITDGSVLDFGELTERIRVSGLEPPVAIRPECLNGRLRSGRAEKTAPGHVRVAFKHGDDVELVVITASAFTWRAGRERPREVGVQQALAALSVRDVYDVVVGAMELPGFDHAEMRGLAKDLANPRLSDLSQTAGEVYAWLAHLLDPDREPARVPEARLAGVAELGLLARMARQGHARATPDGFERPATARLRREPPPGHRQEGTRLRYGVLGDLVVGHGFAVVDGELVDRTYAMTPRHHDAFVPLVRSQSTATPSERPALTARIAAALHRPWTFESAGED